MFCFDKKYLSLLMFLTFVSFVFPRNRDFKLTIPEEFFGERIIFENDSGKYDFLLNSENFFDLTFTNKIKTSLLLDYLVRQNLEGFCRKLQDILLRHSSYYDLNSKTAKKGLVFFLMGLFSSFDESYEFFVDFNIRDNAYVYNEIKILKENVPLLIIRIAGLNTKSNFLELFDNSCFTDVPQINIITVKKKIIYGIKEEVAFSNKFPRNFFIYDNVERFLLILFFRDSIKKFVENQIFPSFDNFILDESEFHLFLLGLMQNFDGMIELASNKESGEGRPDISFRVENKDGGWDRYIFELKAKKVGEEKAVGDYFGEAILQIERGEYLRSASVGSSRSENIYKYVFVFDCDTQMFYYKDIKKMETNYVSPRSEEDLDTMKTPRRSRR